MRVYRPLVLKHLFVQHLDLRCTLFERSVRSAQDVFGFIGCMVVDSFVAVATLSAKNGWVWLRCPQVHHLLMRGWLLYNIMDCLGFAHHWRVSPLLHLFHKLVGLHESYSIVWLVLYSFQVLTTFFNLLRSFLSHLHACHTQLLLFVPRKLALILSYWVLSKLAVKHHAVRQLRPLSIPNCWLILHHPIVALIYLRFVWKSARHASFVFIWTLVAEWVFGILLLSNMIICYLLQNVVVQLFLPLFEYGR